MRGIVHPAGVSHSSWRFRPPLDPHSHIRIAPIMRMWGMGRARQSG